MCVSDECEVTQIAFHTDYVNAVMLPIGSSNWHLKRVRDDWTLNSCIVKVYISR